jgi:hypothetical protein
MKGDVKNKLHRRRRREIFLDLQPPPFGLRGAWGPDRDGRSLHRVQSDVESVGFHVSLTSYIEEHFQSLKRSGLYGNQGSI